MTIPGPRPELTLVLDALEAKPADDLVLGLDFGTATSKAAVVRGGRQPLPLRLGCPQPSLPTSFAADSTLLVTEDHRVLFGSAAVEESRRTGRPRIDSLKSFLGRISLDQSIDTMSLERLGVHAAGDLRLGTALRAYLSWLTLRAERAGGQQHGLKTKLYRRFAVPCWPAIRARVMEPLLARMLADAVVVADTLGEALEGGISRRDLLEVLGRVVKLKDVPQQLVGPAVREPVAAAASRFGPEQRHRGLVLVIDVGAGTTDLALFVLEADPDAPRFVLLPIEGGTDLIGVAGDAVDRALMDIALRRLGPSPRLSQPRRRRQFIEREIRSSKERLLAEGEIVVSGGDISVPLTRADLFDHPDLLGFESLLRSRVRELLDRLPAVACRKLARHGLTVCLAGGGARLPSVAALVRGKTRAHGVSFEHQPGPELPRFVAQDPSLRGEYPRLAVALGGASAYLPVEGRAFSKTLGSAERRLANFQAFHREPHCLRPAAEQTCGSF